MRREGFRSLFAGDYFVIGPTSIRTRERRPEYTLGNGAWKGSQVAGNITREELRAKMDRGDEFVLVNALSARHYESSHLLDAINLPYEFMDKAKEVLPDKDVNIPTTNLARVCLTSEYGYVVSEVGGFVSDIKLFQIADNSVTQLTGTSVAVEKSLQHLIEAYLDEFLGIRFLASEYSTGKTHGGRIDTLGMDENGFPVIIEYKRSLNENVINQGLFYLDWLMDHKAEFTLLVMDLLGKEQANNVEWSKPRLLCIAGDFTKYDEHAVQQINRNIELIRYRRYGEELLLFELVNASSVQTEGSVEVDGSIVSKPKATYKTITEIVEQAKPELRDRYEELKAFLLALGDDVQVNTLKYYFAFKRIKNFACVELRVAQDNVLAYVKVDPDSITLEEGFTRDVRNIGHYGTGDLEITIRNDADLEKAKPLLLKSYDAN